MVVVILASMLQLNYGTNVTWHISLSIYLGRVNKEDAGYLYLTHLYQKLITYLPRPQPGVNKAAAAPKLTVELS